MSDGWKPVVRVGSITLAGVLALALAGGGTWLWWSHGTHERNMTKVREAGFVEKTATVGGARFAYAEGPDDGRPPLLLIHGQGGDWKAYAMVLPQLTRDYHVFAVDCFGHGTSAHDPELYSANTHGEKLAVFIEQVIGEPAVVSGHSSGGVLAAWLAGNASTLVRGVVLEDPPLFTTQLPRARTTWNWVDLATTCHTYLATGQTDWLAYAWEHQRMWSFFKGSAPAIIQTGLDHHAEHPDEPIRVWYIPQFDELMRPMAQYDPRFGEAFYTGSWDAGLDLEETLGGIEAPATLIHTKVAPNDDGILMAAMGHEEADRARALIDGVEFVKVETGHGFHMEDPARFVDIMHGMRTRI